MPVETEVVSTGAEAAPDLASAAPSSEAMTEEQAASAFLADLEGRGTGSINADPIARAAEAPDPPTDTPAEAPAPPPDPSAPAPVETPTETQPLAMADGRTVEWVQTIGDEGAIIDKDALPKLRETFEQVARYEAQTRDLTERLQQVEAAGGLPRIAELSEHVAMLDAAGTRMLGLLRDQTGAGLMGLLMQNTDGTIVPNPTAIRDFLEKIESDTKLARYAAKDKLGDTARQYTQRQSDTQQAAQRDRARTAGLDAILREAQQSMPGLTADDLDDARVAFGPLLASIERPATAQEIQRYGFTAGQTVLGPEKLEAFLSRRAQRNAGTVKDAKAAAENVARLRAAGSRTTPAAPSGRPGAGKAPPPTAKGKIAPDDDGSFSYIMNNAMVGRHSVQDG